MILSPKELIELRLVLVDVRHTIIRYQGIERSLSRILDKPEESREKKTERS